MMLKHSLSLCALATLALSGCHKSSSNNDTTQASSAKGLVFTSNNSQAYPWKSNLYRYDLDSQKFEKLLDGESNDTIVVGLDSDVLFFNRTSESQNYRLLTPENDTISIGAQTQFAGGSIGDPHDALDLGNDVVILAHWIEGKLTLMNKKTGEKISDVSADWDLPSGAEFKPEAFWQTTVNGKTFIYVVHQGSGNEGFNIIANGSQALFVLEKTGEGTVQVVDLDPNTAKVQGIKLKGSFPIPVTFPDQPNKLVLVGLCSRWISPSTVDPSKVCTNAAEELDPSTNSVTLLWDFANSNYFMNGGAIAAASYPNIYTQVEEQNGSNYDKRIVKIHLTTQERSTAYEYDASSGGYYGMYFDHHRKQLLVGDIASDSVGKLVVISEDGSKNSLPLDAIPTSGAFVN